MIDREEVVWGYKLLLEREPESEIVIREKLKCGSSRALVDEIICSGEFREKHPIINSAENRWVMIEHSLGFRIWVNLADSAVSGAIMREQFEHSEVAFVQANVKSGDEVIDIGTNIGFFSLLFSKLVGREGRVVGFEPLSFLYEAAIKSVSENHFDQCAIHNVALSSERGSAQLIYAPGSTNWGGAFLSFDGVGLPDHASITVPLAPLSDFVSEISASFVKIDVEGAEHLVMSNSLDYLSQHKPIIMSEIHSQQLQRVSGVLPMDYIRMMAKVGYRCYKLDDHGCVGGELKGDEGIPLVNVIFLP